MGRLSMDFDPKRLVEYFESTVDWWQLFHSRRRRNLADRFRADTLKLYRQVKIYMGYGASRYIALCTIFNRVTVKMNTTTVFISKK